MTWGEFIRMIKKKGIKLKEHDKKHDLYWNPKTGAEAEIPRHLFKRGSEWHCKKYLTKIRNLKNHSEMDKNLPYFYT